MILETALIWRQYQAPKKLVNCNVCRLAKRETASELILPEIFLNNKVHTVYLTMW